MKKKEPRPDVLEDVLSGMDDDDSPSLDALDTLIHRSFHLTPPPSAESAGSSMIGRALRLTSTGKRKTTIYLSERLAKDLDLAKESLRRLVPAEARGYVSKSAMANIALRILIRELERRGEESVLVKQLAKLAGKQ